MAKTVFYAWQSDRPNAVCRGLIRSAIDDAVKQIVTEAAIAEAEREEIVVDQDTQGIPGSPHIAQVIFGKIESADVFVGDLTFVGSTHPKDGASTEVPKPIPNPNVMLEYGYAARTLGYDRIVGVINTFYGEPGQLPFDLRFRRFPVPYRLAPGEDKAAARAQLVKGLVRRIRGALNAVPENITAYEYWRDLDQIDLNTASGIWAGTRDPFNVPRHLLFRKLKLAVRSGKLDAYRMNGGEPNIKTTVKPEALKSFLEQYRQLSFDVSLEEDETLS